jgi:hypothetical protein
MAAVAGREPSDHELVGQVFKRPSPILTWRPVKVQRITPTAPAGNGDEALADRFSRAPTKRMVAWPVMPGARAARANAMRALLTLVAFALLCAAALTVCVYVLFGEGSNGPSASRAFAHDDMQTVRVGVRHVASETFDSLLPAAPAAGAIASAEPATSVPSHKPTTWHPRRGTRNGARSAHRNGGNSTHGT